MMDREEGPAIRGMAMGTMKGSSFPSARPEEESISLAGKTMPSATRNSRMPPEMLRVEGSSPSRFSRNFPEKKKRSSRLNANTSSRVRIAFCWAGEYFFSIPWIMGARPTGSMTMNRRITVERKSCMGYAPL